MDVLNAPDRMTPEQIHTFALHVTDLYQAHSALKWKNDDGWSDIVREALIALQHDALLIHRAVGELVAQGWSSSAAPLVRTMLDITISMIAVVNSESPRLAAFRYFHAGYRSFERDASYKQASRSGARSFLRARIRQLEPQDHAAALEYLRGKERAYWFSDEWKSPTQIIDEFGPDHIRRLYRQYSAAAHGGFLGLRVFRDRPFDSDTKPRLPVGRNAAIVVVESSRLLIELLCLRDRWENLGYGKEVCPRIDELFSRVVLPDALDASRPEP